MNVYVLVLVTYDYYRFQDNLGVFKSIEDATNFAKKTDDTIDVLCYDDNFEETMDNRESKHWCVQSFYCA